MASLLLLALPVAIFLGCGLVVLVVLAATARPDDTLPSEVASARRHGLVTAVLAEIAFVVTIALLVALQSRPSDGVRPTPTWLGAVPLIGSMVALVVLALGELTWPRPSGAARVVNLNPRSLRDLVPRSWAIALAGLGLVTVAVAVTGWWVAAPDGHSLTRQGEGDLVFSSAGPFPGAFYVVPQLLALAATLVLLYGVLRLVVLRPAVVRSDVATDNRLRMASTARAIRVVVSALAFTAAADLFFGGAAGVRLYDPGWQQSVSAAAMVVGLVLGVAGCVLVLMPAPRLPRDDLAAARPSPTAHQA